MTAGAVNSNVNAFTPYYIHISRKDTEQELTSYSLVLPKGVTGKLAGVAKCSEAAIAVAKQKRGFQEAADPSCPASSQVGRTLTGYGVGTALTYTEGQVYLAGPYHGAPLSLVTINPATVGPFDLGTVVIRSAFQVDQHTAQLRLDTAASDPIPHILDGVVLHLREIRIYVDRPNFTHNPSSCEASALTSRLTGSGASFENPADDSSADPSSFFQLLNCRILGFQPRLGVRLRGGTKRGAYPQLRTTFAARGPNDSNLKEIAVIIPRQEFLAQEHIRSICTKPASSPPNAARRNRSTARRSPTPRCLDEPLRGNVYLRSSSGALPDLVADLHSRRDPHRLGRPHRPGQERRHPGLLQRPARRAGRTLHDDPLRRQARPSGQLRRHLRAPAGLERQGDRPEQRRGGVHLETARAVRKGQGRQRRKREGGK